ncbi:hypothetical protein BDZ90DRAFT_279810 [Jaminaea rosea]|uniref:Uncharacterized protein n=1 Tax=Jaminaea rosea TaxID=1569628 RepID=A0A316UR61_9BASI|nr:hypothetical protein BDZ90DRAFT_279810 [Jaminaea rosea]PWN27464.1 hypothetical protein BDZ90DRAFT_279810 [Jaminaea rosea]
MSYAAPVNSSDPAWAQLSISYADSLSTTLQSWPMFARQAILGLEILASCPAEIRIVHRLFQRGGKANVSEGLFFALKYLAITAFVADVVNTLSKGILTDRGCAASAWVSALAYFLASTIVTLAIALRAYIVFGRNIRCLQATAVLCFVHLAVAILGSISIDKATWSVLGFCVPPLEGHQHSLITPKLVQHNIGFWFIIYSIFVDSSLCVSTCVRLVRSKGPVGWLNVSKLLFDNSLHYMLAMTSINLVQVLLMILSGASPSLSLPTTLTLAISVQICLALRFLTREQDMVHGRWSAVAPAVPPPMSSGARSQSQAERKRKMSQRPTINGELASPVSPISPCNDGASGMPASSLTAASSKLRLRDDGRGFTSLVCERESDDAPEGDTEGRVRNNDYQPPQLPPKILAHQM